MTSKNREKIAKNTIRIFIFSVLLPIIITLATNILALYFEIWANRPNISVEYVQFIEQEDSIRIDGRRYFDIYEKAQSILPVSQIMQFQRIIPNLVSGQISNYQKQSALKKLYSLKNELSRHIQYTSKTKERFQEASSIKDLKKAQFDTMGNSAFSNDKTASLEDFRKSLLSKISQKREEYQTLYKDLQYSISYLEDSKPNLANFIIKISVYNRGNTDGLIRHSGALVLHNRSLALDIIRTAPPNKPSGDQFQSVPVSVSGQPTSFRRNDVGKVEQKSMVNFWFRFEETKLLEEEIEILRNFKKHQQHADIEVRLYNQDHKRISYYVQ